MNALLPQRPVSALVLKAMRGMHEQETVAVGNSVAAKNSRQAAEASLKEELERYALGRLHELRAFLRPLEVIATLSPLLGLLGTVLGMIVAFQQMEAAGRQVDPTVLSGGIWQALLTTAVGLAVAIPVVAVHSWLERKTDRVAHHMNDAVTRVFTQYGVRDSLPVVAEKDPEVMACAA
jgi:biopolymer transport protein ExbB